MGFSLRDGVTVMGFSLRQAFAAGAAALFAAAAGAELSAHNPDAAIGLAVVAGINIITAGITSNQPG